MYVRTITLRLVAALSAALSVALCVARSDDTRTRTEIPLMGIGLGGVSSYTDTWQFVDMMRYSREWRTRSRDWQDWTIVEDAWGWPVSLRHKDGATAAIDNEYPIFMYMYYRRISGDVVVTWEGDGKVALSGQMITLKEDEFPDRRRRVYTFAANEGGVFDLAVSRSNPEDHVRNIHIWMPGFEKSAETFHPLWKERLEPFAYFRFMDWGATNNSKQKKWDQRTSTRHMRQTAGVAYEYMIQLCNEMDKDAWICIPHMADDDYVAKLARLLKTTLEPERRIFVEYSNEIWNPAFQQTHWLWNQAKEQKIAERPWEGGATLCGRRSAEIWKIMARELDDPDRILRVITHFRYIDRVMEGALDKEHGDGRVDVMALNGYFISQDAVQYAKRDMENWDIGKVMDTIEQLHLLGKAMSWQHEMRDIRENWPWLPITCYEGGQHFANPFSSDLQGKALVEKMIEVNAHPRIRNVYRTALETWRLAGGDGFTPFVECGPWSKYGCWGHLRYLQQPLSDVVDNTTGEIKEQGAHKYVALLDFIERWQGQDPSEAPRIQTTALPDAIVGAAYETVLVAEGGTPPYQWTLLGGRLPAGITLDPSGKLSGTPRIPEQLVSVIDCTDSRGHHASKKLGLFIDPSAGKDMQTFDFTNGLPEEWQTPGGEEEARISEGPDGTLGLSVPDLTYLPASSGPKDAAGHEPDAWYTAEVQLTVVSAMDKYRQVGLAFSMSPDGDPQDYLRIYIDGPGHHLVICSRYVKNSPGELWSPRRTALLSDEGEAENDPAFDPGETWTLRASIRPGASPGASDLLISVFDQDGKSRINGRGRTDVANGVLLMRELVVKDALRRGPFGLHRFPGSAVLVKRVRWSDDRP